MFVPDAVNYLSPRLFLSNTREQRCYRLLSVETMDDKLELIVTLPCLGLAIILQLIIGILTINHLQKSKVIGYELKYLFILSFILALLSTIALTVHISLDATESTVLSPVWLFVVDSFAILCILGFFMTLLGTLVARLHITFKGSALKMTKKNMYLFAIIFGLMLKLLMLGSVYLIFENIFINSPVEIQLCFQIAFLCIFVVGSAQAIRLFVINMFELTKWQSRSTDELTANAAEISLNSRQQKMLNLSAKYVSLFCMASLSTILFFFLSLSFGSVYPLNPLSPFDFCINLLRLSLQFSFADQHYERCCCCWDSCCRAMVYSKAKKSISKEHNSNPVQSSFDTDEDAEHSDDDPNTDLLIDTSESKKSAEI